MRIDFDRAELAPIRRTGGQAIVWCLSLPDLMLAKLAAGRRPHDVTFVEEALAAKLETAEELRRGVDLMSESSRDVTMWLDGLEAKLSRR